VVAACAAAISCAKVGPPPGGPEDRDPPHISATLPAADSSGVAPSAPITIAFSEGMDRRSVMKALRTIPPQDIRPEWAEDTLHIVPEGEWPKDRPVILWISTAARDGRGNPLARPLILRFTTGADSATGTISGRIHPGKEAKSPGLLLVVPFPVTAYDSTSAVEGEPVAIAEVSKEGAYRLTKIAPGSYRVVGIFDRDGDARAGDAGEAWGVAPEPVTVAAGEETKAAEFLVGTLDSVGTIHAEVMADSGRVVMEASEDSAQFVPPAGRSTREGPGPLAVQVPTGKEYFVRAFADANRDSLLAPDEIVAQHPERISFRFSSEQSGIRFDLRRAKGTP